MIKVSWAGLMAVALLIAAPAMATFNLTNNGGFEIAGSGGPTDSAQWDEFKSSATNISVRSTENPEFGSYSHKLFAQGLPAMGTVAGLQFNSATTANLPSLEPGSILNASFDAMTPFGPGGVMNYTLRILNRAGNIVGIYNNTIPSASSSYRTFTTSNLTVPALGAAPNDFFAAFFEVNAAAGGFAESTATIYVDNVQINGTPEPASLALVAFGAMALLRRRMA